jgi:hypothetical protein
MCEEELAAKVSHEVNRAYCRSIGDDSQPPWEHAPQWQKDSVLAGVKKIIEKPAITAREQHECWMEHKIKDGWVYGNVKDVDSKTHPCIVDYDKLPDCQKRKNVLFGASVRAVLGLHIE